MLYFTAFRWAFLLVRPCFKPVCHMTLALQAVASQESPILDFPALSLRGRHWRDGFAFAQWHKFTCHSSPKLNSLCVLCGLTLALWAAEELITAILMKCIDLLRNVSIVYAGRTIMYITSLQKWWTGWWNLLFGTEWQYDSSSYHSIMYHLSF